MDQHQGMNGYANEESSNTEEVRATEQKPGSDSKDVDMKPASPVSLHPSTAPTTPTTPEALKLSSKRGNKIRVRLNLFHKRRKASPLEHPTNSEGRLFGRSLATICQRQPDATLPTPVMELLRIVYVNGPATEGIFRRSASKSALRAIKKQLDSGIDCGPIEASNLLTELLRKLPDCLLCCGMYDQWLESSSKTDQEDRISSIRQLVRELPPCNLLLLRHLICVVHRISRSSEQTKMTSRNLSVCLSPSLLWSKTTSLDDQRRDVDRTVTTVRALIDHAADIFGPDCLQLFHDLESCSTTALSTDQQADLGIESTDRSPLQRAKGSSDPSTTSPSQTNALSPTSLDPPPVAPPRRKRSSVVVPPQFVSIAEESTSSSGYQSATPIAAKQALEEDKPRLSRSHSSDSEFSSREWLDKSYGGMDTTDGETIEDSDETSATEEDLDGQRSSMLSEDFSEDSSMVSPTVERRKDSLDILERRKSGGTPTTVERNLSKLTSLGETKNTKDLATVMDGSNLTNLTKPQMAVDPSARTSTVALMSFSSTEDSTAGDRSVTGGKRLFFGSSFSSTAGSDADHSTFAESIDSGAFSESFELPGIIRKRRQLDVNGVLNSSATMPLSLEDCRNREVPTVAYNTHDRKYMAPKHQRGSQINAKCEDREVPAKETASTDEHAVHVISESSTDMCDSGISSVTNDSGLVSYHKGSQETDTSDQSALLSRRHSFGCRDPGNVAGLCGTEARQRRGMTHKGSDVFPGILSKTLGSRSTKSHLHSDSNGSECKSMSGTKSENESGGRMYHPGKKRTSEERIIVSDIEFSESAGKTHNPSRQGHRTAKSSQSLDSPGASRLPISSPDGRQLDSDVGESNSTRTPLMEVNEEDEEKNSKARRLRLEPPDYDEAVKHLKSQQRQTAPVISLKNQEESVLQKEGERTVVKENEKEKGRNKQPAENCSTQQRRLGSVGIDGLDLSALAKLAARSCGDLSKLAEQNGTDVTKRFQKPEHESALKHVSFLSALSSADSLRKRFCIPRSKRWSIRDSSSSSSDSDEEAALQRRQEDNLAKKRIRRKKYRRSRKARNSDTRLQTDRENRVNLVRSKSDSNTLIRELLVRKEDAEHARETFRNEFSRRKADQRHFPRDVFKDCQEGKENLNNITIRVKNLEDDELPSTTREGGNRKTVALKDRDWHKDLVREIESTQKSQPSYYPVSGTPVSGSDNKWQIKTKDAYSSSANRFKNANNTGTTISTNPGAFQCISKTKHGRLLDYSSGDSMTKRSTDDATHISERARGESPNDSGERRLHKPNDEGSASGGGSGGDGSGSSTTSFIERRANQLKKSEDDFQKDSNRSKEIIAMKCTPKEYNSNLNFLGVQKPNQRRYTLGSDIVHGNTRDRFKEKADTQPSRELTVQPVIKINDDDDNKTEKTSSDSCKSSTSAFQPICVKDIVAMKNSSSGSAGSKNDLPKPPVPSSSCRRGEERTEAWKPETGRSVARRASHVIPQVKSEVEILLTPELSRKTPPKPEQKPRVPLAASMSRTNPSECNRLPLPVRAGSHSVKSSNVREPKVEQKKNAETAAPRPIQATAGDASTISDPSQGQKRLTGVSKPPWQATSPLPAKSSQELSRSDVFSADPGKVLPKSDAEVCANEKGEKRTGDCGEPAAGQSVPRSQGSDSGIDKSTKKEMPWSVANLRNMYGNQNPQ